MYWLFGGTPKTIPGFVVGALIGGTVSLVVTHFDKGLTTICTAFTGLVGETIHYYMRSKPR